MLRLFLCLVVSISFCFFVGCVIKTEGLQEGQQQKQSEAHSKKELQKNQEISMKKETTNTQESIVSKPDHDETVGFDGDGGIAEDEDLLHEPLTRESYGTLREIPAGLPDIPSNGWAKTVIGSKISKLNINPSDKNPYPNLARDPRKALGKPEKGTFGTVALGKKGRYILVDLGKDDVARDGQGNDLVVIEMGLLSGGSPEPYQVFVSNNPTGPFTFLGKARGEAAFDFRTVGVTSARYVRVESLATIKEIFSGFGSPFYPGPEIDAIGAVYPGDP